MDAKIREACQFFRDPRIEPHAWPQRSCWPAKTNQNILAAVFEYRTISKKQWSRPDRCVHLETLDLRRPASIRAVLGLSEDRSGASPFGSQTVAIPPAGESVS